MKGGFTGRTTLRVSEGTMGKLRALRAFMEALGFASSRRARRLGLGRVVGIACRLYLKLASPTPPPEGDGCVVNLNWAEREMLREVAERLSKAAGRKVSLGEALDWLCDLYLSVLGV